MGNVGQLTVDLIVNSLRMPRVGYLDHPAILPLVGNDAFDHTQPAGFLHTAAEGDEMVKLGFFDDDFVAFCLCFVVYHSTELNLLAVQLRTPLIKVHTHTHTHSHMRTHTHTGAHCTYTAQN